MVLLKRLRCDGHLSAVVHHWPTLAPTLATLPPAHALGPMTADTRLTPHMFRHIHTHIPMAIDPTVNRVLTMIMPLAMVSLATSDPELTQKIQMVPRYRSGGAGLSPGLSSRVTMSLNRGLVPCYFRATTVYVMHHPFSVMTRT
jgi:hypothetical protein